MCCLSLCLLSLSLCFRRTSVKKTKTMKGKDVQSGRGEDFQRKLSIVSTPATILIFCTITLHAVYVTVLGMSTASQQRPQLRRMLQVSLPRAAKNYDDNIYKEATGRKYSDEKELLMTRTTAMSSWPDLIIFRRTKKTGSSSMMNALMVALQPFGYYAPSFNHAEATHVIHLEFRKPRPRRIMMLHHNRLTRSVHPHRKVLIVDTLRDGYKHVTSYCRYMKQVKTCGSEMEECLRSKHGRRQMTYRWAGNPMESADTYIDLPLSSEHPALSTAVLRSVFPNVTLNIDRYNVHDTACPREGPAKTAYDELYVSLDKQVDMLWRRMLIIAGYPVKVLSSGKNGTRTAVSMEDLVNAAERIEAKKSGIILGQFVTGGKSNQVIDHLASRLKWSRAFNGSLVLIPRRILLKNETETAL